MRQKSIQGKKLMSMKCIIMEEAIKIAKQREDMSVVTKERDPKRGEVFHKLTFNSPVRNAVILAPGCDVTGADPVELQGAHASRWEW